METYNLLNLDYVKFSKKVNSFEDINNDCIMRIKKNIFTQLNNLKKELINLENNKYDVFNNLMKNYFSLFNDYKFYSYDNYESFQKLLSKLDNIIMNRIFQIEHNNKNLKILENSISSNIEKLNKSKRYLFFELYNFNNNSIKSIDFDKIKNYYIYNLLNNENIPNTDLIENIGSICNLEENDDVIKLINLINSSINEINSLEMLNFYEVLNKLKSNYQELIDKCESLDLLINENIFKINDYKFFQFTISTSNLNESYNDIMNYIEIKKKDLEKNKDYESFILFYNIFVEINRKLDICEKDIFEITNKETRINDKIKYIKQEIDNKNDEIVNLNKKKNNNSKRNDKIKLILNTKTIIHGNNDSNLGNEINEKIKKLNSIINSQILKIFKMESLLEKKNNYIESILNTLDKLKNKGNIMYKRYKIKFNDISKEKKEILEIKEKIEEELTYNKNNLVLLEKNPNKSLIKEENNNYDIVKNSIENIDNEIFMVKDKEKQNKTKILSLLEDKEKLEIELKNYAKTKMKLLKQKRVLDDDLYNNQEFLKSKFYNLFNQQYYIDNVKNILKKIIIDSEQRKSLEKTINTTYNYNFILKILNSYQNKYTSEYEKIVKNIQNIKKFTEISIHSNQECQKLFTFFMEDITLIIELFYYLRIDLHNYFYLKNINNFILKNETNINFKDLIYHDKLNDILIEEKVIIYKIKSNIFLLKNHIRKEKQKKKKKLIDKYYNNLNDDIKKSNEFNKKNLIIKKLKNSIITVGNELNSIYNYLISSI